jgi:hypothetical protein
MNRMSRNGKVAVVGLLGLMMLAACVAGGYDGEVGVGYVGGFYEPGGYEYGGWGPAYRVGPPRREARAPAGRPEGRAAPSIPQGARGGGGGHGGGRGH